MPRFRWQRRVKARKSSAPRFCSTHRRVRQTRSEPVFPDRNGSGQPPRVLLPIVQIVEIRMSIPDAAVLAVKVRQRPGKR